MFTNIWIFHHQRVINMVTMAMITLKNLFLCLKQEPQNLFLSAFMYQNMIILHYFLDFLKS